MRIGLLTGGGDAPGLNGIIESVSRVLLHAGHEVVGIRDGFEGVFNDSYREITLKSVESLHTQAGTFLGTSNKCGTEGRESEFLEKFKKKKFDGLIVAGGDGTFKGLKAFASEIPMIGVPKTIDNDLSGTEITFGFDTACSVVADAGDDLRATADAHKRIIVVETMGRTAGWIALGGGMACFADVVLLPERPFEKKKLIQYVNERKAEGNRGLLAIVAEGAHAKGEDTEVAFRVKGAPQEERFGGIAHKLAHWLEAETGWDARPVVLGHLQRSRRPTPTDRFLTMAMGVEAARMAIEGKWGLCSVYREGKVTRAPVEELMGPARLVPHDHRWVKILEALGSFV